MSTQTPIPSTGGSVVQDVTMEEIYDALMFEIEPDLTLDAMQDLDVMYAGETPEENAERKARYERAFALVDERMSKILSVWKHDLENIKRKVMKGKEGDARSEEIAQLNNLDASFSDQ